MKKLYFLLAILMVASIVLSACGGSSANQTSFADSSVEAHGYYEPEGPTVHFYKVGNTVNVSLSHYVGNSPTKPVEVMMVGDTGSANEGLKVNFSWTQEETYKPELMGIFDSLCSYQWVATIDGKKAITQHIEKFDGACWVEFVFTE